MVVEKSCSCTATTVICFDNEHSAYPGGAKVVYPSTHSQAHAMSKNVELPTISPAPKC